MNYTLKNIFPVNMELVIKIQATAVPLVKQMGIKYWLLISRLTSLLNNYTLKND